jgi:hypothetical protein
VYRYYSTSTDRQLGGVEPDEAEQEEVALTPPVAAAAAAAAASDGE